MLASRAGEGGAWRGIKKSRKQTAGKRRSLLDMCGRQRQLANGAAAGTPRAYRGALIIRSLT